MVSRLGHTLLPLNSALAAAASQTVHLVRTKLDDRTPAALARTDCVRPPEHMCLSACHARCRRLALCAGKCFTSSDLRGFLPTWSKMDLNALANLSNSYIELSTNGQRNAPLDTIESCLVCFSLARVSILDWADWPLMCLQLSWSYMVADRGNAGRL